NVIGARTNEVISGSKDSVRPRVLRKQLKARGKSREIPGSPDIVYGTCIGDLPEGQLFGVSQSLHLFEQRYSHELRVGKVASSITHGDRVSNRGGQAQQSNGQNHHGGDHFKNCYPGFRIELLFS